VAERKGSFARENVYDALSLAAGAREAALEAPAAVRAPWLSDLGGQAGLLAVERDGIPRALSRPGRD